MNPAHAASSSSSAARMPATMQTTTGTEGSGLTITTASPPGTNTTTTTATVTAGTGVTALTVRSGQDRQQETESLLDRFIPEILGEIGRQLYEFHALRPSLNAITQTSHAGKALAVSLCSKLTPKQAFEQWQSDWLKLLGYFKEAKPEEKERYLATVRTIAGQLTMTPMHPSETISPYFVDVTAPEFIASIPRVALPCNSPAASQAALRLLESQLTMPADARTEIIFHYLCGRDQDLFDRLIAAARQHGNCCFSIVDDGTGKAIAEAATKDLVHYMSFMPKHPAAIAAVASALKCNTSLRTASIVIAMPMNVDELILALSRLPCLQQLVIYLPGPGSSQALPQLIRSSTALVDLTIMSSRPSSASEATPDAALIQARVELALALEARGPSLRYDIDPLFLPKRSIAAPSAESKD